MADFENQPAASREQAFLSRALTAHAVRVLLGCDAVTAVRMVIDGREDQGLDAIAISRSPAHVYLVQTKWNYQGKATLKKETALKALDGLRLIDGELSSQFNSKGQLLAQEAKQLFDDHAAKATLVTVLMGTAEPSAEVAQVLENGEHEFNGRGAFLDHRIIYAAELWDQVQRDHQPPSIDMSVLMSKWFDLSIPYTAYQGAVSADDVVGWLDEHGSALFTLNIRNPLGVTVANSEVVRTLLDEPANFWYFNNGVTILCDSIEPTYYGRKSPHTNPVRLDIKNASVVNGAQTVSALAQAVAKDDDAATALVRVTVIETGRQKDFAQQLTKATNSQNRVEARDFITLDSVQSEIRADMRAELGLSYTIRRGEPDPSPMSGCSVVEAATALACAHSNPKYAARLVNSSELLWERGAAGTYDILFHPQPNAFQVWNSVLTHRRVRDVLHELRPHLEGRAASVLDYGSHLISHLVTRYLDDVNYDDPELKWAIQVEPRITAAVPLIAAALTAVVDEQFERAQIRAICADPVRCKLVAEAVLKRVRGGTTDVKFEGKYLQAKARTGRRPNAVPTIVEQEALAEGTPLTLYTPLQPERDALTAWLTEDPRRTRATWVNSRTKPLLWEADRKQYSPSGLIKSMWEAAQWENRPVANQGTARWKTPAGETLTELANRLLSELEENHDQ